MLKRSILLSLLLALAGAAGAVKEVKTIIHTDHLGSPIMGRSVDGETVWERHYEPYGAQDQAPEDPASAGYTGHLEERDSGLVYAGARWYDPRIGRFMSPDPVGFSVSNPVSFNRYAYANNNPYRYRDPDGQVPVETVWDAANVSIGLISLRGNVSEGNYGAALLDLGGVIVDGAATAAPYVPGGVSSIIKAARSGSKAAKGRAKALPPSKTRGNPNSAPENGTIYVDSKGNAIPTPPGGRITGSPDGRFIQARDANGNPTGVRIDGGHSPKTHTDPRALGPHGHVPGVTNADGTPWLPINR